LIQNSDQEVFDKEQKEVRGSCLQAWLANAQEKSVRATNPVSPLEDVVEHIPKWLI
jgi:hypothetical protein